MPSHFRESHSLVIGQQNVSFIKFTVAFLSFISICELLFCGALFYKILFTDKELMLVDVNLGIQEAGKNLTALCLAFKY